MSQVYVFQGYGDAGQEALIDRPVPEAQAGELAVEVRAAGVNPADSKMREGLFGRRHTLPKPMGLEVAGVVTGVGEGVTDFAVGDSVLGAPARNMGGFAEHTILKADAAVAKPDNVSFAEAATVPLAATTAFDLMRSVALEPGDTVAIVGAGGGVGYIATQVGIVYQCRVIAVASEAKRGLIEATGAVFVASGAGFVDRVRDLAPDGVDLLVDLVGGDVLREAAPLAKEATRIVSAADGDGAVELGGAGRSYEPGSMREVASLMAAGRVASHVTATFPLARAREALAVVESGHSAGKTVVTP